jgi:hypothetical protein
VPMVASGPKQTSNAAVSRSASRGGADTGESMSGLLLVTLGGQSAEPPATSGFGPKAAFRSGNVRSGRKNPMPGHIGI